MRFLHTADLHIGGTRFLPRFLERQEAMLDAIFDIAYDQDVDVVVVAGDVFDIPDPSPEERHLVQRKFLEYDAAGYHILCIPGNHDLVNAQGETAIHYLAMLHAHGRFKNSTIVEHTAYVKIRDTVFCLLCHRPGHFRKDSRRAVRDYHRSSIDTGASSFVVVCHETIQGSLTDARMKDGSHYRMKTGEEAPDMTLPVTYWACGDIHKHQAVGSKAFYSGSPVQTKFDDDWPKGVLIVDTDDPEHPKFVPVPSNQLVKAGKDDIVPKGAFVKLKVRDAQELSSMELPENVVKFDYEKSITSLAIDVGSSLRDKLTQGIRQQNPTDEELEIALGEIETLLSSVVE
jgi:DNA repair protein SbcD/Mre11